MVEKGDHFTRSSGHRIYPQRSGTQLTLYVACAAEWSAPLFISAGGRQYAAAKAYGLWVEELKSEETFRVVGWVEAPCAHSHHRDG